MKTSIKFFIYFHFLFIFSCTSVPMIKTQNRTSAQPQKVSEAVTTEAPLHRGSELDSKIKAIRPSEALLSPEVAAAESTAIVTGPTPLVPVAQRIQPEAKAREVSDRYFETNTRKIGVILPLTGKASTISQRALAAIRMGLKLTPLLIFRWLFMTAKAILN